jgi:hypothetical protein
MARAGNGQEFGKTFDDAENQRFEENDGIHGARIL